MLLLSFFAFLAGVVTIISPCILPILPIVLSGSISKSNARPLGIIFGFIVSFTFFTLFISALVTSLSISADSLRNFSVVILFLFGLSLVVPQFQHISELMFSKLTRFAPQSSGKGFVGGVLVGFSLGLVWTPCVGPILASVITLAAAQEISIATTFITLSYAVGTAIPMVIIMITGRSLFQKIPWLLPNTVRIQKIFGIIIILVAVGIFFNIHRSFQAYILTQFPEYGTFITQLEENRAVEERLYQLD